jgi:hypothetical protein
VLTGPPRYPLREVLTGPTKTSTITRLKTPPKLGVYPSSHGSNPDGSTPGALQGDDYPLEYYEDGYPKLPACLDRRKPMPLAEAA